MPICSNVEPPLIQVREHHYVACHLYPDTRTPSREALTLSGSEAGALTSGDASASAPSVAG